MVLTVEQAIWFFRELAKGSTKQKLFSYAFDKYMRGECDILRSFKNYSMNVAIDKEEFRKYLDISKRHFRRLKVKDGITYKIGEWIPYISHRGVISFRVSLMGSPNVELFPIEYVKKGGINLRPLSIIYKKSFFKELHKALLFFGFIDEDDSVMDYAELIKFSDMFFDILFDGEPVKHDRLYMTDDPIFKKFIENGHLIMNKQSKEVIESGEFVILLYIYLYITGTFKSKSNNKSKSKQSAELRDQNIFDLKKYIKENYSYKSVFAHNRKRSKVDWKHQLMIYKSRDPKLERTNLLITCYKNFVRGTYSSGKNAEIYRFKNEAWLIRWYTGFMKLRRFLDDLHSEKKSVPRKNVYSEYFSLLYDYYIKKKQKADRVWSYNMPGWFFTDWAMDAYQQVLKEQLPAYWWDDDEEVNEPSLFKELHKEDFPEMYYDPI